MGTKQLRLSDPDQIKNRISNFLGKKINIVLLDNTVVFGVLKAVEGDEVQFQNMRQKKIRYPFTKISEIYLDTKI